MGSNCADEVQPGSLLRIRLSRLLCVRSRQVLLEVEPLLLVLLVLEVVPKKPPPTAKEASYDYQNLFFQF